MVKFSHQVCSIKAVLSNSIPFLQASFSKRASIAVSCVSFLRSVSVIYECMSLFPFFINGDIHSVLNLVFLYLTTYFGAHFLSGYIKLPDDFLH